jgi:hypothetical protein
VVYGWLDFLLRSSVDGEVLGFLKHFNGWLCGKMNLALAPNGPGLNPLVFANIL